MSKHAHKKNNPRFTTSEIQHSLINDQEKCILTVKLYTCMTAISYECIHDEETFEDSLCIKITLFVQLGVRMDFYKINVVYV